MNYPPFSLANGSRVFVLVGVTFNVCRKKKKIASSSSFILLNGYDNGSFLFSSILPPFLFVMNRVSVYIYGRFDDAREKQDNQKYERSNEAVQ
mmetsp:Transcript_52258/g.58380  ORF Transcript_52258/g.58380 Transcript_52258/m.58380 type:complete len:93 (-) Transcript_52258:216-494(-)